MIVHHLLFLLASISPFQDGQPASLITGATAAAAGTPAAAESGSAQVEALRGRIHGMRMNLLLGGEKVRSAETDATRFYREKAELVEQRLDSLSAEMTERRSSYQLSLEQALRAPAEETRKTALREAGELRRKVLGLETEQAELVARRTRLEKLVEAVEARGRERQRLATKVESEPGFDETFSLPLGDVGLAPELEVLAPSSLLDDPGLVEDLLARDEGAARQLLFEADPRGYWNVFPLQPPAAALAGAMEFPPPDLPGQR